jgi:hypothetical protein
MRQNIEKIKTLIIHCSATPNGKQFTAKDIDGWHKTRGFNRQTDLPMTLKHIGYHYVVRVDGVVEFGRWHDEVGAHTKGHNKNSIAICMVGTDKYTRKQWAALAELVGTLEKDLPIDVVAGHRDFSPDKNGNGKIEQNEWVKICPGFNVAAWHLNDKEPLSQHILDYSVNDASAQVKTEVADPTIEGFVQTLAGATLQGAKPWWESKTVLGIIVASLPMLAKAAGIDYDAVLLPYAGDITQLIGSVLAIIGRATASANLSAGKRS